MTDGPRPNGPSYEDDFYAWTQYQAEVLRALPTSDNRFDRDRVAEEIEDLGKNYRDAVRSQVRRILEHFLKLAYSPAGEPRYGWRGSIIDARAELDDKLSPTLHHDIADMLTQALSNGTKEGGGRPARTWGTKCRGFIAGGVPIHRRPDPRRGLVPGAAGRCDMSRDFVGYGAAPPDPHWPGAARVAVNFVINFEEGSELSYPAGDGVSETGLIESASTDAGNRRDLAAESMFEYGVAGRLVAASTASSTASRCRRRCLPAPAPCRPTRLPPRRLPPATGTSAATAIAGSSITNSMRPRSATRSPAPSH